MLTFQEFIKTPRCKPLLLADEDQPQDIRDWRKLEKQHQEEQYDKYRAQFEPPSNNGCATESVVLPVAQHKKLKKDKHWWREYRKRPKKCPHCGKDIKR
jgi:hypothetical protein